jgi:hypothetical protein
MRIINLIFGLGLLLLITSCRKEIVPNELLPRFQEILENPYELTKYDFSERASIHHIALPFDFGSNQLRDSLIIEKLDKMQFKYITYVYSDYRKNDKFKQEELNIERLYTLYQFRSDLFEVEDIDWKIIKQTGAKTEQEAKELYHGFVVYYRPVPTKESMKAEADYIKSMLDTALTFIAPLTETTSLITEILSFDEFEGDDTYYYGDSIDFSVVDTAYTSSSGTYDFGEYFKDTTVSSVLSRNKQWNNMLIHCDLTGSMSPYSAQLFVWHRLNIDKNKVQHFVFFNDGDMAPDNKKVAGKTGGLYYSKADNFEELKEVAFECMRNGYGGDAPENDIEAILNGLKKCENCKDIILIADNWANMRDYEFINKIDKPIKIILCGTQFGINKQYLDLARQTKGSIHTIEEDILNLMEMKEGEEISISGHIFKIEKGRFIEVTRI